MSKFKYIEKNNIQINDEYIGLKTKILVEIAYQLKRIADKK